MATPSDYPWIGRDIPWKVIDGEFCRILRFAAFAIVEENRVKGSGITMPLALLTVESPYLPQQAMMPVTHRLDFANLWAIYEQRGVKPGEEVLVIYVSNFFQNWIAPARVLGRLFSSGLPRLHLFIYPEGHLEEAYDPEFRPPSFVAWFKPIAEWRPKGWR